jgi:hypothetical protein
VISIRTAPHCERLVLPYSDEKTLCDLVARPSIVVLGCSSREEAEACICCDATAAQPLRQKSMGASGVNRMKVVREFIRRHQLARNPFSLWGTQSVICTLLQQTFAAAVVLLYSRNLVSAAVRALISF